MDAPACAALVAPPRRRTVPSCARRGCCVPHGWHCRDRGRRIGPRRSVRSWLHLGGTGLCWCGCIRRRGCVPRGRRCLGRRWHGTRRGCHCRGSKEIRRALRGLRRRMRRGRRLYVRRWLRRPALRWLRQHALCWRRRRGAVLHRRKCVRRWRCATYCRRCLDKRRCVVRRRSGRNWRHLHVLSGLHLQGRCTPLAQIYAACAAHVIAGAATCTALATSQGQCTAWAQVSTSPVLLRRCRRRLHGGRLACNSLPQRA